MTVKHLYTSSSDQIREIGKLIRLAIRFLVPFVLLVAVLNYLMSGWDPSPHYSGTYREMYRAAPVGANTLILGGSNGKFGVNPRALERCFGKTLNMCLNGSGPLIYQSWYEDIYLHNCQPPSVVILVLNEYIFDPRYMVRRIEHDAGYLSVRDFFNVLQRPETELSTMFYNRLMLTRRRSALWHAWFGTAVDEHVDMTKWYHGWAPAEAENPFARSPKTFRIKQDEKRMQALRTFMVSLRDSGIRVVVVNPPYCRSAIELIDNASPEFRAMAQSLGLEYLDYNGELSSGLNNDRSFFMDWEHLNTKGAMLWSETLASDLCDKGSRAAAHD